MAKYAHIVFDIDGTLIDTKHAVMHGLQDAVRELTGRDMPIEDLLFSFGIPGEEAMRILGMADLTAALAVWNRHIAKYRASVDVFPGLEAALEALSQANIAGMGIVTSKTRAEYEVEFTRFNISRHFTTVITADDTDEHKPQPGPLLKYMELTGAQACETLYIGDSIYDMRCARAAGVDSALALWGAVNKDIESTWRLNTPEDLIGIICK